uniref:Uncharacterized protein n=1 Tax=Branchiostoma floridae TaxID=7739 RepID=C3Y836_BRAFL|eukprot:XP_002607495.1 hypothetical protein BRAFLDRAFT_69926 [Branchiostoma floridae]
MESIVTKRRRQFMATRDAQDLEFRLKKVRAKVGQEFLSPADLKYLGDDKHDMSDEETDEEREKTWVVKRPSWRSKRLTRIIDRCQPAKEAFIAKTPQTRYTRMQRLHFERQPGARQGGTPLHPRGWKRGPAAGVTIWEPGLDRKCCFGSFKLQKVKDVQLREMVVKQFHLEKELETVRHQQEKVEKATSKMMEKVKERERKYDVKKEDLPGVTFCQILREEAGIVSSVQIDEELAASKDPTIHSDGTSKDGIKYNGYQLTTGKGQHRTAGILKMSSGQSAEQLEGLQFTLKKLAMISNSRHHHPCQAVTVQNQEHHGDDVASQKHFNELLEEYRAEILPDVIDGREDLSAEVQQNISAMNHMYCQLHALVGCATATAAGFKLIASSDLLFVVESWHLFCADIAVFMW